MPLHTATPSVDQLNRGTGRQQLEAAAREASLAKLPMEATGPLAAEGTKDKKPSVIPASPTNRQRSVAAEISYPEPDHYLTANECKRNLVSSGRNFYIDSRFAMCTGTKVIQEFTGRRGETSGTASFLLLIRGIHRQA
ncbi:hypothetical protein [Streptomyces nondiastaticus]|uniref:Uncharacterized protein n=1 Tax=Streptomyces nondiastaticus TaxID=3154512 RepID=A0ABW6U7Z3_9ACTN